jgi:serine/threonine kinase 32
VLLLTLLQRPFEANTHEALGQKIMRGEPAFPQTNPSISNPCLHAMSSLLERDRRQRIGAASFESFADNPFFRPLDFEALEAKQIEPIFKPSSDKTNFDATYDLEELLLEEAPLEARARRQKPREQLKDDATSAEIRADELHRMIEKLFEPFDYTLTRLDKMPSSETVTSGTTPGTAATGSPTDSFRKAQVLPMLSTQSPQHMRTELPPYMQASRSRSSTGSPNGSPPLPIVDFPLQDPPRSIPRDYFNAAGVSVSDATESRTPTEQRTPAQSRSTSKNRQAMSRSKKNTTTGILTQSSGGFADDMNVADLPPLHQKPSTFSGDKLFGEPSTGERSGDEKEREKRPSGMLGFLSRKKGRDRSPKARERGVLGKEGARVIVGP